MRDVRRFENNELYAIKARDHSVRTGTKVAVLGAFQHTGTVRPGFKVNMMSTEGVAGTAQVIRFEDRADAERWLTQKGSRYGYDEDDLAVMNSRAGEYVRLPLCDFATDVWVNSVILRRFSDRTIASMNTYCPEYIDNDIPNLPQAPTHYRGFRF